MTQLKATVIATYSRRMRLRVADGREVDARIKGKQLKPVCGDRVAAMPIESEDDWLITAIDPRDNELTRPDSRGRKEILAANVELLVAVAAVEPKPDWFVIDRYLCAAEIMRADGVVVFNKADLGGPTDGALQVFEQVGYPTLCTSAETGVGIHALAGLLANRIAIIVGQSGVGKSSIINTLIGESRQRVSNVSTTSREGRHTTVNSEMIPLPRGGHVIDSPGVRDYAPLLQSTADAITGYREIRDTGQDCRFANCKHMQEPGCAVKAAVDTASINARRYESYRRTLILTEQLARDRY